MKLIMKQIVFVFFVAFVALLIPAIAFANPANAVCSTYCGQEYLPVAKWEWYENSSSYVEEIDWQHPLFSSSVSGDSEMAEWTANPAAGCVVHKEAQDFYVHEGGFSGDIYKERYDISNVVFCSREDEIPEFGFAAVILTLFGSLIIINILRKRASHA